jgi:hypothetical protein
MLRSILTVTVATAALGLLGSPTLFAADTQEPVKASIEKTDGVTQAVVLQNGATEFRLYRSLWQAVSVKTPAGKTLRITDPILYNTHANDLPKGHDAYWSKPENWDSQLTFSVVERPDAPQGTSTVLVEGKRDNLIKQVYISQYASEPGVVYVVNRLRALEEGKFQDMHMIYLARSVDNATYLAEMTLDGVMVDADARAAGKRGAFMYLGTSDCSLGLAMAPAEVQKAKLRDPMVHMPQKTGRELRIFSVSGQTLKAGEEVEIRYALYWGDGNQLREVHAWIQAVADGQKNDLFYATASAK